MFPFLRLWILLNAGLVAGGWLLSAVHGLNPTGYSVLGVVLAVAAAVFCRAEPGERGMGRAVPWRARFGRRLPLLFLALLLLATLGGALWRPEFQDGLAYRTPRVLHWLYQHTWEWIHTSDPRKNNRGVGFEWATAPLLLFSRTDRLVFLLNVASLALLPGLIYSFLGGGWVRARVAWSWAWILAGSTGFVLQAGSIAADLFGVPFYLAAIIFARRAAKSGHWRDVAFSTLAIALLTGVKPFNLVFGLPWLLTLWPACRGLPRRAWAHTAWLLPLAALSSYLPTAWMNTRYTGVWTGLRTTDPAEAVAEFAPLSPILGVVGNTWLIVSQNLLPLYVPKLDQWNAAGARLAETPLGQRLDRSFEHLFFHIRDQETEATAGLGTAVVLLLMATSGVQSNRHSSTQRRPPASVWLPDAAVWVALLAYMMKAGAFEAGRLAMPFYVPLLVPLLRRESFRVALARPWWWSATTAALLYTAAVLLVSRSRPLLPWETVLGTLHRLQPANDKWPRALAALHAHHQRADFFAGIRAGLPPQEKKVGAVVSIIRGATLWLPFGSRLVVDIIGHDTVGEALAQGIHYVILPAESTPGLGAGHIEIRDRFLAAGDVVQRVQIAGTLNQPGEEWLVVKLREQVPLEEGRGLDILAPPR